MNNSFLNSSWKHSCMKFNPIEIISAPLLSRTTIHWYNYFQDLFRKSDLLHVSIMMPEWNIFGGHKEQHIRLWEKLRYSHRPTPEVWRWKKVNFITRTVEFINYSRRSAVKSLQNSVILYNAGMCRLVQNYCIKFTNKHASSFGTWWEVGNDDRVKRLIRKLRTVQQKRKRPTRHWLYTLFFSANTNHSTAWVITFQVRKSLLPSCLYRKWTQNGSVKKMFNFFRLPFHVLLMEVLIYCYAYLINICRPTHVSIYMYV